MRKVLLSLMLLCLATTSRAAELRNPFSKINPADFTKNPISFNLMNRPLSEFQLSGTVLQHNKSWAILSDRQGNYYHIHLNEIFSSAHARITAIQREKIIVTYLHPQNNLTSITTLTLKDS